MDASLVVSGLKELRECVSRQENDFSWSSWVDEQSAMTELDQLIERVLRGDTRAASTVKAILAPTGPTQELAISSGWGEEFAEIADRIEVALRAKGACPCFSGDPSTLSVYAELGLDKTLAESTILRCSICGELWLKYFYQNEAVSGSGRWYLGLIRTAEITADQAKATIESLEWYLCGGSFYGGKVSRTKGFIQLE